MKKFLAILVLGLSLVLLNSCEESDKSKLHKAIQKKIDAMKQLNKESAEKYKTTDNLAGSQLMCVKTYDSKGYENGGESPEGFDFISKDEVINYSLGSLVFARGDGKNIIHRDKKNYRTSIDFIYIGFFKINRKNLRDEKEYLVCKKVNFNNKMYTYFYSLVKRTVEKSRAQNKL